MLIRLAIVLLVLPGCSFIGRGIDRASDVLVEQLTEYCAQPAHRRQALYILANGELEPHDIEIMVTCPGE